MPAHLLAAAVLLSSVLARTMVGSSLVQPPPLSLRSGALQLTMGANGSYALTIDGKPPTHGAPLSVFVGGAIHTVANGGLVCAAPAPSSGSDNYGSYHGADLQCTAAGDVPAVFSWAAYAGAQHEGKLMATLSLPDGANGTDAQPAFTIGRLNPALFAPFPSWRIDGAFDSAAFLCYGGDKAHLYSSHSAHAGGTGLADPPGSCFKLGNGPTTMLWGASASQSEAGRGGGGGLQALVAGPASAFHLNYNTKGAGAAPLHPPTQAKLWYNAARGDVTLCLTAACCTTQHKSGYTVLFDNEGSVSMAQDQEFTKLYFSWSSANKDNWVTNTSACPGPSYTNCGNADGTLYSNAGNMGNGNRIEMISYSNANSSHHMAAATDKAKAWALAHGYSAQGSLGWIDRPPKDVDLCTPHTGTNYVCCDLRNLPNVTSAGECCALCKDEPKCTAWGYDRKSPQRRCYLKEGPLSNPVKMGASYVAGYSQPPVPGPAPGKHTNTWNFGVSGDVKSVPPGFKQSTFMVHSLRGATAAWDSWGAALRKAHKTVKKADEDIFLAALTLWTDNGAATLGPAWNAKPGTSPPRVAPGPAGPDAHALGPNISYMNWNWSMVSTEVYGKVADSVKATGVAPRGTQLDCWWYPVQTGGAAPANKHPFWCVSDWVLPEEFYPGGTGGLRKRQGVPQMMYFPALCVENAWNEGGKYTWSDTAFDSGFVVPVAEESLMFWGDMFDYGQRLASKTLDPEAEAWPGVWAPAAVQAGWKGTNLAAYETDFYHNIVSQTPQFRQVFGAGEMFLDGINGACAARNMTAQLCAGNPPSFLSALTMPSITNARASIDYDWDGAPGHNTGARSNNGNHNWAAPDNSWVFWATRIAPSKDNFWSSFRDLFKDGGKQNSHRNGKDAELHAINALLLTGPVGLGDTCVGSECMTNGTLVHRLARADGILLRPDRPMAPLDVMFGGLLYEGNTTARAMPGLCTKAQDAQGAAADCGSRLWQTHATVYPENVARAPELATAPTRRLVSHGGVDATEQASVPDALRAQGANYLLQHLVVSVDQPASFKLQPSDLYPLPEGIIPAGGSTPTSSRAGGDHGPQVMWRAAQDGGRPCVNGSDAVASGCIAHVGAVGWDSPLLDVSTAASRCSQLPYAGGPVIPAGPTCLHAVGIWQVWVVQSSASFVLLGDLSKYVSLSGYRFRLPAGAATATATGTTGEALVVTGMPDEIVDITYLRKLSATAVWTVHVQRVTVGEGGRAAVTLL